MLIARVVDAVAVRRVIMEKRILRQILFYFKRVAILGDIYKMI